MHCSPARCYEAARLSRPEGASLRDNHGPRDLTVWETSADSISSGSSKAMILPKCYVGGPEVGWSMSKRATCPVKTARARRHTTLPPRPNNKARLTEARRWESSSYLGAPIRPQTSRFLFWKAPERHARRGRRRRTMIYPVSRLKNNMTSQNAMPTSPSACCWRTRTRSAHACVPAARHWWTDTPTSLPPGRPSN